MSLHHVRREQNVTVTINKLGLRGEEIKIPKPDGIRRFITTGDSSVFGFGVEDNEVFSKVADEILGYKVQSICGAIHGYSSFQSVNLLHLRGLSTEPDLLSLEISGQTIILILLLIKNFWLRIRAMNNRLSVKQKEFYLGSIFIVS